MERLEKRALRETLICDGAMGTFLQRMGLVPGECPEKWCLDHPDHVKSIHQAYRDAGSHIVETNTFGGSVYKLKHYGLENQVESINRAGAALGREIAGTSQYVLGSIGPTGAFMEPYGDETEESFYAAFKAQAEALQAGGADAVIIETMMAIEECCVAVRAARENTNLTVIASLTFDPQPNGGYASMMGVRPDEFAKAALAAGAHIIGSNCGLGPDNMIEIVKILRASVPADVPVMAMPNAGMPSIVNGETVFNESPAEMAAKVILLKTAGANIIGGCCGVTPEHIRAMAQAAGE